MRGWSCLVHWVAIQAWQGRQNISRQILGAQVSDTNIDCTSIG
jgi:hypothetical protein